MMDGGKWGIIEVLGMMLEATGASMRRGSPNNDEA